MEETPPSTPASIPLSAELRHDGEQFIATCPEIPEATGKGPTDMEALMDLRRSVDRYFEKKHADQQGTPPEPLG
jgi:hypothetical protein